MGSRSAVAEVPSESERNIQREALSDENELGTVLVAARMTDWMT